MIALDTNILARFYCDDPSDPEAQKQQLVARRIFFDTKALWVPLTVMLELEWVMRGFYKLEPEAFCRAAEHLIGLPHVTVERWESVQQALDLHRKGLDFADALHWACSQHCSEFLAFDDRKFARRAQRLALMPKLSLAK